MTTPLQSLMLDCASCFSSPLPLQRHTNDPILTGELLPVQYTPPPMYPEEQQEEEPQSRVPEVSNSKGKRKARPDEIDEE